MATPKVVAVVNKKGGVGKSTTTINLAAAAQMAGVRTGIIDIDADQQASAKWGDVRAADFPVVRSGVYTRIPQTLAEMEKDDVELVFIDGPAAAEAPTREAMKVAQLALVPCRTTVQDLQYLSTTMGLAADLQKPAAVVLNSVETHIREFEEAQAYLNGNNIPQAPGYLSKAVAFHRALVAGLGVTELEPAGKAAQEVLTLLEWISRLLDLSNSRTVEAPKQQRRRRSA